MTKRISDAIDLDGSLAEKEAIKKANAAKKAVRGAGGRFAKGTGGGPGRKPAATAMILQETRDKLLHRVPEIVEMMLRKALEEEDIAAALAALKYLVPSCQLDGSGKASINGGKIETQLKQVMADMRDGHLSSQTGNAMISAIGLRIKLEEQEAIKNRIAALEAALEKVTKK